MVVIRRANYDKGIETSKYLRKIGQIIDLLETKGAEIAQHLKGPKIIFKYEF